jgi:outer membrane protein TolC
VLLISFGGIVAAEQLPLKRAVELALAHSTTIQASHIDEQRAFAAYQEVRNQFLPQLSVGSGLGKSYGYPLSLEGSAPSIVNTTAQFAVLNPALRDFVRAARTDYQATTVQTKDQRNQVIQDTVLSYAKLSKWEALMAHLSHQYEDALKMEQTVNQRVLAGVDNPLTRNQARLNAARVYLHISQAQGAIDVLRNQLSQVTGLPAIAIETVPESIPELPEVKQEDNLAAKAAQDSPLVQIADIRASALAFRARGEHRSMWPSVDFAAQYALLASFNNYQHFFVAGSFQPNNATVGVQIRFPFLNPPQRAHAQAADAAALRAKKDVETAKNQVSEQTLKLQGSVAQLGLRSKSSISSIRLPSPISTPPRPGWTQAARRCTNWTMRAVRPTSVTTHCRTRISNFNGRASACSVLPANWRLGWAWANKLRRPKKWPAVGGPLSLLDASNQPFAVSALRNHQSCY